MLTTIFAALAVMSAPTAEVTAEQPEEKKVCRKVADTGSFTRGQKVCRTRTEWQKVNQTRTSKKGASESSQSGSR